ncbi:MAG: BTAD domain-containing putative transcriptional regulator, partial [Anaerolineales bacterium]|nr:BTAD domain-containing putative transcriptional regulator [Anaerolineales bacterium]
MPHLAIRLLGRFEASLDETPLAGFDSDKVRALLAYLVVEADRPQRREKLAGLLWPDYPESSARTSLRRALANLRDVIRDREVEPPFLTITRQTIQFNKNSASEVDVLAFLSQVGGDVAEKESAVGLYHGDFLEGFSVPDSIAFEEWLVTTREALQAQALAALHKLARHYEGTAAYDDALVYARRAVEVEPFDESAHRAIMRSLAAGGMQAQALAHYENFNHTLKAELDVDPSPETTALAEAIGAGAFRADRPGAGMLRGYEIFDLLGEGYFGAVYRAHQAAVSRDVAVKIILPEFADDPDFIRRFESEAQLVARLEHPHIVPLYDYWREPGGAYLVMRLLRGGSLKRALERGPWSGEAAARLV